MRTQAKAWMVSALAMATIGCCGVAYAQDAETQPAATGRGQQRGGQQQGSTQPQLAERRLPADSITQHTLELPGRTLKFSATAGSLPLRGDDGRVLAEVGFVAYTLPAVDKAKRPVTFAFNGGPGSASAWLHLGGLGPWRLPLDAAQPSPSAPPVVVPNAETLLDFTDLVFIDPVGTGYSRIARNPPQQQAGQGQPSTPPSGGGGRDAGNRDSGGNRYFWSVNGDVESVAEFIRDWTNKNGRAASPKAIIGESYGGIRGPKVTSMLQTRFGVGIKALVLVSPVIEYGVGGTWRRGSPTGLASLLPSLAASALELKDRAGVLDRTKLAAVEAYARGEYLQDLMRGPRDAAAVDRLVKRVAELTGIAEPIVRQHGGRIDSFIYRHEANRAAGQMASIYDSAVKSFDPDPTSYFPASNEDPFTSGYAAPMTSAIAEHFAGRLGYRVEANYNIANRNALREWIYPNTPFAMESSGDLKSILALDPKLKVLVTHGFTDTITPYFASDMVLAQIPAYGDASRLKLNVYPGGHMFYSREPSRKAFRDDVAKLLE